MLRAYPRFEWVGLNALLAMSWGLPSVYRRGFCRYRNSSRSTITFLCCPAGSDHSSQRAYFRWRAFSLVVLTRIYRSSRHVFASIQNPRGTITGIPETKFIRRPRECGGGAPCLLFSKSPRGVGGKNARKKITGPEPSQRYNTVLHTLHTYSSMFIAPQARTNSCGR